MEKRTSPRHRCCVPLLDEQKEVMANSQTMDISRTGVGFESAYFIPVDTKITVEISLSRDAEPMLVQGRVKWVEKSARSSTYKVGMTFPDISSQAQSRIDNYFKE